MGKMKDLYTEGITDLESYHLGIQHERVRFMETLRKMGVVRDAMFYEGLVIYTEEGARDIAERDLTNE